MKSKVSSEEPTGELDDTKAVRVRRERLVLRQIFSRIRLAGEGVAEAGTVVNVGRGIAVKGESNITAEVQRVALVVVERAKVQDRKIGQAAVDGTASFGDLIGVCQVDL